MGFQIPATSDFKAYFKRNFPYGTDPIIAILDEDIQNGIDQVLTYTLFNPALFGDQKTFNIAFLHLAAHYLVENLRISSQGLNSQFNFLEQSKSVESTAQSFAIPERILENPEFAMLCKTDYGARYLSMVLPQLSGQMFTVAAQTNPA